MMLHINEQYSSTAIQRHCDEAVCAILDSLRSETSGSFGFALFDTLRKKKMQLNPEMLLLATKRKNVPKKSGLD